MDFCWVDLDSGVNMNEGGVGPPVRPRVHVLISLFGQ